MTARFPSQRIHREPPLIHRRPAPTMRRVPSTRQLWLHGVELGRDVVDAVETGQQLIDEAQVPLRRPARVDWGAVWCVLSVVALVVITALVLTGGYR